MVSLWDITTTIFACISLGHCYGPHHPKGSYRHHRPHGDTGHKLTQDTQLLQDKEHIREDLEGWVSDEDTKKMTPQELEFHYFKIHDFDNNTKLDGLEILQAIQHTMHTHEVAVGVDTMEEEEHNNDFYNFVDLIDRVLEEDDLDKDGYLSYIEYVIGRQKDERGPGS